MAKITNVFETNGLYIWQWDNKKFIVEASDGQLVDTLKEARRIARKIRI